MRIDLSPRQRQAVGKSKWSGGDTLPDAASLQLAQTRLIEELDGAPRLLAVVVMLEDPVHPGDPRPHARVLASDAEKRVLERRMKLLGYM